MDGQGVPGFSRHLAIDDANFQSSLGGVKRIFETVLTSSELLLFFGWPWKQASRCLFCCRWRVPQRSSCWLRGGASSSHWKIGERITDTFQSFSGIFFTGSLIVFYRKLLFVFYRKFQMQICWLRRTASTLMCVISLDLRVLTSETMYRAL